MSLQPLDQRVDPGPLKNRVRRNAEPDHNEDRAVLNGCSADHMFVLVPDVLRHQRVDTSRQGAKAKHQQYRADGAHVATFNRFQTLIEAMDRSSADSARSS
jgi:hypothetical protein